MFQNLSDLTASSRLGLFGGPTLVREWGRIGSSGQVRIEPFADEGQAVDALASIAHQKRRRGYTEGPEGT
ncbi:WGR domain-containing protein [Aliiroseovarius sp. 2305UL8-7]|uniref:WGR domain-containing protein n=1 Tax=Aliiroseovarius conchicola TaxID=3121637 RepID=UPI0035271FC3